MKHVLDREPEFQLHLAMDTESYAMLNWLKGALEAASFSEVIRRALQAYEIFEPDELAETSDTRRCLALPPASEPQNEIRTVHVRIPLRTKERLDHEKEASKATYSKVVERALTVLAQIVVNRSKFIELGTKPLCTAPEEVDADREAFYEQFGLACA